MRVNVRISLSIRINEMSVVRFLALVEPKLQAQLGLATKIKWLGSTLTLPILMMGWIPFRAQSDTAPCQIRYSLVKYQSP